MHSGGVGERSGIYFGERSADEGDARRRGIGSGYSIKVKKAKYTGRRFCPEFAEMSNFDLY